MKQSKLWVPRAFGLLVCAACGNQQCPPEVSPYVPRVAPSTQVDLPEIPREIARPSTGSSVWEAAANLRDQALQQAFSKREARITGYIVATNFDQAPDCAWQAGTSLGCDAPVPSFWLADTPDRKPSEAVRVMGWASSFGEVRRAFDTYERGGARATYTDRELQENVPNPLPAAGAKVVASGAHRQLFVASDGSAHADRHWGILDLESLEVLTPAPQQAQIPIDEPR